MKKTIVILIVIAVVAVVGYAFYREQSAPTEETASGPRVYTNEEKADILKNLASQSTSTVPSVADQEKILKALAGESGNTTAKPNMASATPSSGGMSDEEKIKILQSLSK